MTNHAHICPSCQNFVDADEADIVNRATGAFLTTEQLYELVAGLAVAGHVIVTDEDTDARLAADLCRKCLVLGMAAAI